MMEDGKRLKSSYRQEGYTTKIKNGIKKYVPKPGYTGLVGGVIGSGVGATVGGVGSALYYLITEGAGYALNGGGTDVLSKAYQSGIQGAGTWALILGVGGMFLSAKIRDLILGK